VRGAALTVVLLAAGCASVVRQVPDGDQLDEADRTAWVEAARAFDHARPREALEHLAGPLAVEPWHVPSHTLRQDVLRRLGRDDEAAALYAAGLAPEDTSAAHVLLAHRTLPQSFSKERAAGYLRAMELDAGSPWPRLALCYDALRRAADALAAARAAARSGFTSTEERERVAARSALEEADARAREALSLRPGLAVAHAARAGAILADPTTARRPERLNEALVSAGTAARLDPGNPRILVGLARVRREAGDDTGAVEALERALAATGGAPEIAAFLGRVLLDLRRDGEAREHLERAAGGATAGVAVLLNLGVAEFRLEEFERAAEAFERARAAAPGDPRPLEGLALARARLGERSGASDALRDYLELDGTDRLGGREFIDRMEPGDAPLPPLPPVVR